MGGYLAGVDRSGRGFNPRPAETTTAQTGSDRLRAGAERLFAGRNLAAHQTATIKAL